ncbi:hypothetical protein ACPESV_35320, partial [Streptomyces umbrinus]
MSQARDHGGNHRSIRTPNHWSIRILDHCSVRILDHWSIRKPRNRVTDPGASAHGRTTARPAVGMPVLHALPVLIVSVVVLADFVGGAGMVWLPLLAAGPALAATTNGPRGVVCVGVLA